MTKQELMENFTKEQIVDRIIILDSFFAQSNMFNSLKNNIQFPIEKSIEDNYKEQINQKEKKLDNLEKELVVFKDHRNALLAENNEIKCKIDKKQTEINQIDEILNKLFGVTHDVAKTPDEFEKILREKAKHYITISDFLPTEPIKVADMLINAEGKRESLLGRVTGKGTTETCNLFDIHELRQIAEHLMIYCNANSMEER